MMRLLSWLAALAMAPAVQSPPRTPSEPAQPSAAPQPSGPNQPKAAAPAPARTDGSIEEAAANRTELEAIANELDRGMEGLALPDRPRPYRAEARLVRADLLSLDGSYGGIITNVLDRQAVGTVDLRVGTIERDNTNFFGADSGMSRVDVPLRAAPRYLRKKLWLGLDRAFRGASKTYAAKIVALRRLAGDELPPDFTAPPPAIEQLAVMSPTKVDREGLASMVSRLSARFVEFPAVDNGDVHLQVLRTHETVVNTEGLRLQWVRERAVLAVVADTKAPDGMHIDHGLAMHLQGVPAASDELLAAGERLVDQVLRELQEQAAAPLIEEEYDGPILFVGPASSQLLGSMVATEIAGTPAPIGDGGRMMELEPKWLKRLGKTVMPPFVDLVDDPTEPGFGSFDRDAEGIVPERLVLVEDGELKSLLMTRVPNGTVSGSNGRARMSPALESGPTISNLTLRSQRRGYSQTTLERELLRRAREDGYEFAYVIERLRDGTLLGPVPRNSAAAFAGTGKIDLPLPARVWRIEPGGKRTLVRGAVLAPASMRVLRRIRAVGNEVHTEAMRIPVGTFGGWAADVGVDGVLSQTVDVQITTPQLLIDGLELLVERGEHERLPTLDHPLRRKAQPDPKADPKAEPKPDPKLGRDGTQPRKPGTRALRR